MATGIHLRSTVSVVSSTSWDFPHSVLRRTFSSCTWTGRMSIVGVVEMDVVLVDGERQMLLSRVTMAKQC